jgi:hypothetical protein
VNILEAHLVLLGPALLLTAVLVALIFSRKGPHPATYKLSEPWTHGPILWAATDEVVGDAHHEHGTAEFSVGGGASGKW